MWPPVCSDTGLLLSVKSCLCTGRIKSVLIVPVGSHRRQARRHQVSHSLLDASLNLHMHTQRFLLPSMQTDTHQYSLAHTHSHLLSPTLSIFPQLSPTCSFTHFPPTFSHCVSHTRKTLLIIFKKQQLYMEKDFAQESNSGAERQPWEVNAHCDKSS